MYHRELAGKLFISHLDERYLVKFVLPCRYVPQGCLYKDAAMAIIRRIGLHQIVLCQPEVQVEALQGLGVPVLQESHPGKESLGIFFSSRLMNVYFNFSSGRALKSLSSGTKTKMNRRNQV